MQGRKEFIGTFTWEVIKKKYNNPEIMLANCDMEYEMMLEYYEMKKDKILYKDDKVYLYYNDEWNIMTEKGRMVKNDLVEFYYIWYKVALDLIHKEETKNLIEKNAEKDELIKKLRKIQSGGLRNTVGGTNINHIFNHLLNKLSCIKTEIEFDIGKENYYDINFKNGIYNVKTKNFRSRIQTDYITKYLDYDYIEPSQISQTIHNDVLEFFKKVQPNEEQRKFTLSYLAYCLTGDTTKQIFKMNIGHTASNGKSTEMSIHHKCFGIYTKKMDNRVLLTNFANRHKHIIDLVDEPVRLVYFEEMPKGKKLDVDFIKDFVDGKGVSCEIMFGTKADIKIQAKLLGVSSFALLIRALNLEIISPAIYQKLKRQADVDFANYLKREAEKKAKQKEKENPGGPNYFLLQLNRNSRLFTQTVLDAFRGGYIEPTLASSLLNVQVNKFQKLESQLYK
jgi:phage/plasmid-associated DNA primase